MSLKLRTNSSKTLAETLTDWTFTTFNVKKYTEKILQINNDTGTTSIVLIPNWSRNERLDWPELLRIGGISCRKIRRRVLVEEVETSPAMETSESGELAIAGESEGWRERETSMAMKSYGLSLFSSSSSTRRFVRR